MTWHRVFWLLWLAAGLVKEAHAVLARKPDQPLDKATGTATWELRSGLGTHLHAPKPRRHLARGVLLGFLIWAFGHLGFGKWDF